MKREPRWVAVFLRALERSGNVRLAAEGAGVDFSTAYQRRKRHAEFAERWEGALAAFQALAPDPSTIGCAAPSSLRHAPGMPISSAPPPPGKLGEELNVRPDGKIIKGSDARWGKRAEEAFLLELTTSGNVRRAAKAAGFSTAAVYKRRLKSRHFAAAWDAALETGKARVQAYLIEAATRTFDPDELPIGDEREIPKVSISEAINIAKLKAAGPVTAGDDEEYDEDQLKEVRERILYKLERLREREIEAGWTPHLLEPPLGKDGGITEVWLPPGYALVKVETLTCEENSA